MVVLTYRFRAEPGVTAIYEFLAAKILNHLFFERLQGLLLVHAAGEQRKCQWNAVTVSEKSHLYYRVRAMLLAFSVFLVAVFLLDFEIIVCTVIIQDLVVALCDEAAVFVDFRLNEVALLGEYRQRSVDIMHFICGRFQKLARWFVGRTLAVRFQYPGLHQAGPYRG